MCTIIRLHRIHRICFVVTTLVVMRLSLKHVFRKVIDSIVVLLNHGNFHDLKHVRIQLAKMSLRREAI